MSHLKFHQSKFIFIHFLKSIFRSFTCMCFTLFACDL